MLMPSIMILLSRMLLRRRRYWLFMRNDQTPLHLKISGSTSMASRAKALKPASDTAQTSKKRVHEPEGGDYAPFKVPRMDLTKDAHFRALRSDVDTMGSKVDLILNKLSAPAPPPTRPVHRGLPSGFRVEHEDVIDDST